MLLNRERLAEMLGCSLRTVDEYRRQGMPGDAPKRPGDQWRFESAAVVEWIRDRERSSALGDVAKIDEAEAKRRKMAAEAALAELELALKQREAVSIADFEAAWAAMIGAARAKLLGIGAGIGPEVAVVEDPYECSQMIHSAICEALQELSESRVDLPDDASGPDGIQPEETEDSAPVVASAGSDRKRMGGQGTKVKSGKQR